MALETFNFYDMPEDTSYGSDPNIEVVLSRGMSRSEFDDDELPIKSLAFRHGLGNAIKEVVEVVNTGDGDRLLDLTVQQTTDGLAESKGLFTPFISARRGDVSHHAAKHRDGIIVDFSVPANAIIVPWLMDNAPGKEPSEVLVVGAIPRERITSVRNIH